MMKRKFHESEIVLISTPTANDGTMAEQVLTAAGLEARSFTNFDAFCLQIQKGCGVIVLSEESLTESSLKMFGETLAKQPKWSDLPIILLTKADIVLTTEILAGTGNISLLERPFSQVTLIRSVEVALRARRKQYEVCKLLEDLNSLKDEAERANFAKSSFLANMSHEIRTPIGAMMGFVELLDNGETLSPDGRQYLSIIQRNAKQLLLIVDDILDISKVEAGKLEIDKIDFDTSSFIEDLLTLKSLKAAEKGVRLEMKLMPNIPRTLHTDPLRLRQILVNLIGNALKFTEAGSVSVRFENMHDTLIIDVEDTGIGLSAAQAQRLFQPFTQADSSTSRKYGGTGLGLSLSAKLAQLLGGTLILKSSVPGKGSIFQLILPITGSHELPTLNEPGHANVQNNAQPLTKNAYKHLNLLLVEDSVDNQLLISTYLKPTGVQIDIRGNGREAVEAVASKTYDFVLMDIQMPELDGHEAVKIMRANGFTKPIVALTAHAMNDEKERCLRSGFNDYLTKPVNRTELIKIIGDFTQSPNASNQLEALNLR